MKAIFAGMSLIALAPVVFATSVSKVNPVAGVSLAKVEINTGGPLTTEGSGALELFAHSIPRADAFEAAIRKRVTQQFEAHGIAVSPKAQHTLVLQFFGRPVHRDSLHGEYIALIEASFHDERRLADPNYCGASLELWGRSVLEVSSDSSLEQTLKSSVTALVDDLLRLGNSVEDRPSHSP